MINTNNDVEKLTSKQVIEYIDMDTPLANARKVLTQQIEAILEERNAEPVNLIKQRRMELKAVLAVARALKVEL